MSTIPMGDSFSRREFIRTVAGASALIASQSRAAEATAGAKAERFKLITFTKPFQDTGYERTADVVAEAGWNGIECPVRKKGQVEPERVEEELPKLVAALRARNLTLDLVTTDIIATSTFFAEKVLRTAKQLGCTRYRMGIQKYDLAKPIAAQLAELKPAFRDLAAMNKEIGVCGGIQNHSGPGYLGCAVWDIFELIRDLDPQSLGICFDIGHATVEGGSSWPVEARLMEKHFTAVYVKDFQWKRGAKGFAAEWGPLGEGMVRREFFDWLKKTSYAGPISQHVEYQEGAGPEQIAAMKKDCATLRSWLAQP